MNGGNLTVNKTKVNIQNVKKSKIKSIESIFDQTNVFLLSICVSLLKFEKNLYFV